MNPDDGTIVSENNEDSYYVSITDMMIGLLFLFLILLMYFAVQLRDVTEDLVTSDQTRAELLGKIADYLRERDVQAEADLSAGVLRLPDQSLFLKGRDAPKPEGAEALGILADALAAHLPCYAFRMEPTASVDCTLAAHHVEAIFIEGHTDSDRVTPTARIRDNWDLSAARASNTYRVLIERQQALTGFVSAEPGSKNALPVFSIAGYADQRPVAKGDDEATKSRNRRIDIRFVMAAPEIAQ
jgi:chemotaxis protein MotB